MASVSFSQLGVLMFGLRKTCGRGRTRGNERALSARITVQALQGCWPRLCVNESAHRDLLGLWPISVYDLPQ